MRVEKKTYDIKKHIIHLLAAGAIALSGATVGHLYAYMHTNLNTGVTKTKVRKTKTGPDQLTTVAEDETAIGPPPPIQPEGAVMAEAKTLTQPEQQAAAPTPTAAPALQKSKVQIPTATSTDLVRSSSQSLATSIAAKMGINIINTKIDRKFIRSVEGVDRKAEVPVPKTSQSGVTIGVGFDLGQMAAWEYNKLPLSAALKEKLRPYVGLKRFKAVAFLKSHPLSVNEQELKEINVIAANRVLDPLVKAYNKASPVPFQNLPPEAQTVIFSYGYQWGQGFMHTSATGKKLWNYFTTQNWQKAREMLLSAKQYSGRRHQEAQLLSKL